jgi:hypothetical protein
MIWKMPKPEDTSPPAAATTTTTPN